MLSGWLESNCKYLPVWVGFRKVSILRCRLRSGVLQCRGRGVFVCPPFRNELYGWMLVVEVGQELLNEALLHYRENIVYKAVPGSWRVSKRLQSSLLQTSHENVLLAL